MTLSAPTNAIVYKNTMCGGVSRRLCIKLNERWGRAQLSFLTLYSCEFIFRIDKFRDRVFFNRRGALFFGTFEMRLQVYRKRFLTIRSQ